MQLAMPHNQEHGDRPVFKAAKSALIAIPGHAEYYRDKLNKYYEMQGKSSGFLREQDWSFKTLEHLPSPENARVLGEFLYDERTKFDPDSELARIDPQEEMMHSTTNAYLAAQALSHLIDNPPFPIKRIGPFIQTSQADIHSWRLWYEQVKAGTRTIRFVGDPQDYSLEGPVREARHGPMTNRAGKRDEPLMDATAREKDGKSGNRMIPALLAGLLAAFALWRYLLLRRKATA